MQDEDIDFHPSTMPTIFLKDSDVVLMLINKVASSTVRHYIQLKYGDTTYVSNQEGIEDNKLIAEKYDKENIYTWVRNPFSRLVSCYIQRVYFTSQKHKRVPYKALEKFGVYRNMSWREFVERVCDIPDEQADPHFISQSYRLKYEGELLPGTIYHMESFNQDWKAFRKKTKMRKLPTRPRRIKNTNNKRALFGDGWYVHPQIRDKVIERYEEDFELFGYDV